MRLIKPSYDIWEQDAGGNPISGIVTSPETMHESLLEGIFRQIERAGRVCYKSEDRITEGSARKFVDMLIANRHYAMLEHGTVYLDISHEAIGNMLEEKYQQFAMLLDNPYTKYSDMSIDGSGFDTSYFITTNYRVIVENGLEWMMDEFLVPYSPEFYRRHTVHFICDIGVAREFLRHRKMSPSQESTRWCNYMKERFNRELTFIESPWYDKQDSFTKNEFDRHLRDVESLYGFLIEKGQKPEQARAVLPLCLKTEIVMTGFMEDWRHFFSLRALGTTGKPHPQAEELALPLMEEFERRYADEP